MGKIDFMSFVSQIKFLWLKYKRFCLLLIFTKFTIFPRLYPEVLDTTGPRFLSVKAKARIDRLAPVIISDMRTELKRGSPEIQQTWKLWSYTSFVESIYPRWFLIMINIIIDYYMGIICGTWNSNTKLTRDVETKFPVIAQVTTEKQWPLDQRFICFQIKSIWLVWPISLPGLQNFYHYVINESQ